MKSSLLMQPGTFDAEVFKEKAKHGFYQYTSFVSKIRAIEYLF